MNSLDSLQVHDEGHQPLRKFKSNHMYCWIQPLFLSYFSCAMTVKYPSAQTKTERLSVGFNVDPAISPLSPRSQMAPFTLELGLELTRFHPKLKMLIISPILKSIRSQLSKSKAAMGKVRYQGKGMIITSQKNIHDEAKEY